MNIRTIIEYFLGGALVIWAPISFVVALYCNELWPLILTATLFVVVSILWAGKKLNAKIKREEKGRND